MEITLKLDAQEVNVVLNVIGQLPTSTNIWPLAAKIQAQLQAQIQQPKEGSKSDGGQGSTAD